MKLLDTAKRYLEQRVSSQDPSWANVWGGFPSRAGPPATKDTASGLPAWYAATGLMAGNIASVSMGPYRVLDDGTKVLDRDHPLFRILNKRFNRNQDAFQSREQLNVSLLNTGNFYCLKLMDSAGRITDLVPLQPEAVEPRELPNGRIAYIVQTRTGQRTFTHDEVWHVKYRSNDGVKGISPIQACREAFGIALAEQEYQGDSYRNGIRIGGILKYPSWLNPEQQSAIRKGVQERHAGKNRFAPMVLEGGVDFLPNSQTHQDAQFIQQAKLTLEQIARILNIPPPSLGVLDNATYSNITEQSRLFVTQALRPLAIRIESSANASLLSEDQQQTHTIEHNLEGLLRGDIKTRYEAYQIGIMTGFLKVNEARAKENLPAEPNGDVLRVQMNTQALGSEV